MTLFCIYSKKEIAFPNFDIVLCVKQKVISYKSLQSFRRTIARHQNVTTKPPRALRRRLLKVPRHVYVQVSATFCSSLSQYPILPFWGGPQENSPGYCLFGRRDRPVQFLLSFRRVCFMECDARALAECWASLIDTGLSFITSILILNFYFENVTLGQFNRKSFLWFSSSGTSRVSSIIITLL